MTLQFSGPRICGFWRPSRLLRALLRDGLTGRQARRPHIATACNTSEVRALG
jgi:hypothetical protein